MQFSQLPKKRIKVNKKINMITLGCSKNRVDSEHIAAQLDSLGYTLVFDSDREDASIVIINTCGFIGDAKEESIDYILRAARLKEEGVIEKLFVIGCLSERYKDDLKDSIPEVDEYFGARDLKGIVEILRKNRKLSCSPTSRLLSTPKHYAYLKISEGCNWMCGYCAIPLIRGRHTSVDMETLLQEAEELARKGVRELLVVAQDSTYYGVDIYGKRMLATLLERLCQIKGIEWIRLHYAYPTDFPEDVLHVMAREKKICKYIDIPLQHISDNVLSAMKRRHTKQQALDLLDRIRKTVPGIAIRTTLLTGYPGETEEDFRELMEFVREQKFERLGVFPYSQEEGTYSAINLKDNVPKSVKQSRAAQIMEAQEDISKNLNDGRVGQTLRIIIDRSEGDYYVGRSEFDSPEVDGEVLISKEGNNLRKGCFYKVRITKAEDYDLYGEIVKN